MGARRQSEAPNTGTATTEAPKDRGADSRGAKDRAASGAAGSRDRHSDGFSVGGFVFKPGGRIKLDIIRDFDAIALRGLVRPAHDRHRWERRRQLEPPCEGDAPVPRHPRSGRGQRAARCTSRPTSTAAAVFFGCATRMGARAACWRARPGRPSWTRPTFPTPSTSSRRWLSHRSGRRRCVGRRKLSANVSWSVAVEDNKSTITPPTGVPGKAEYPMPDVVDAVSVSGVRAGTPSCQVFSARRASGRRRASRTT